MGQGLAYTIADLKNATGINSNFLDAHHPDGQGNRTNTNDFLVDDYDGVRTLSGTNNVRLCEAYQFRGSLNTSGSYGSDDYWNWGSSRTLQLNDTFSFRVELDSAGRFVVEQIMSNKGYWEISTNGYTTVGSFKGIDDDGDGKPEAMEVECEYTTLGDVVAVSLIYNPPLNTDIPDAGSQRVQFQTDAVEKPAGYYVSLNATENFDDEIRLFYSIENGTTPYNWVLYRREEGESSFTNQIDSGTESSDVTNKAYSDTTCTAGTSYEYKMEVTDDGGNGTTKSDTTAAYECN